MLKNKIIDTIDTAYVEEQGVKEVVEKAPEIMKKVRYIEEKQIMQKFLYEVGDIFIFSLGGNLGKTCRVWLTFQRCYT